MIPALSTPIVKTPTKTPSGWPDPPVKLTPPRITAVSTSSSKPTPTVGEALPSRAMVMTETRPIMVPLNAKRPVTNRSTAMPLNLAAFALPPIAYVRSPPTVRNRTIDETRKTIPPTTTGKGTGPKYVCPRRTNRPGKP